MTKEKHFKILNDSYNRTVKYDNENKVYKIIGLTDNTKLKSKYNQFIINKESKYRQNIKNLFYMIYARNYFRKKNLLSFFLDKLLPMPFYLTVTSILDIGCSTGEFLFYLPESYKRSGIEINTLAAEIAREKQLDIWEGDFKDYKLKRKFDIIRAFHVIEHIEDYDTFYKKISEYSGKYIILATPNGNSLSKLIFGSSWDGFYDKTHFTIFTKDSMTLIAQRYGFKVNRLSTYPMGYFVTSLLRSFRLNKYPAIVFWLLFFIFLPLDIIISLFSYGDALYVEFEKSQPSDLL